MYRSCAARPGGDPVGLGLRPVGELGVLPATLGNRPFGLVPGPGHGLLGLGAGLRQRALGLLAGVGEQLIGLGLRAGPGLLGLLGGVVDELVTPVEHVLGVVQLAGQRLPDVVQQFEHLAARDHAVRGHRQAPRLLDDGDQRVERFEDPVHARHHLTAPPPARALTTHPRVKLPSGTDVLDQAFSAIRSSNWRCTVSGSRWATSPP